MSAVVGGVPCLVREVFFAPPCPVEVAKLFEVALVRHNTGALEDAINTYLQAQAVWESHILRTEYSSSDLEDPTAGCMLATLMKREKELQDEAIAAQDDIRIAKAERDVALTERLEREAAQLASEAAAAAALENDPQSPTIPKFKVSGQPTDGSVVATDGDEKLYTATDLKRFRDDRQRRNEAREAARAEEQMKTQERQERKMQAMYECPERIPAEAHIFIQLSLGSVLETAGSDASALRSYLYALELCERRLGQGHPERHPITATVYNCLGTLYFHIAQYDFAADYFFKALEIRENLLPEGHVDIASVLNNVGCVLHVLRRTNDALVFFYRAAEILSSQLEPTHPRRDVVDVNIRKAKHSALLGVVPPPIPFQAGIVPPLIPGARRAKEFFKPKPKKAKAKDDKKKK